MGFEAVQVMNKCSAPWHERGMSVSSAANSARSVTSASAAPPSAAAGPPAGGSAERSRRPFHAGGRLDSRSHAGIWTARRNTKRRHTRRDHRRPGCLTASRTHPDDLPVRGIRQPQLWMLRWPLGRIPIWCDEDYRGDFLTRRGD